MKESSSELKAKLSDLKQKSKLSFSYVKATGGLFFIFFKKNK